MVNSGKVAGYRIRRAQMLLKADEGPDGPGWPDEQIAEAFGINSATVSKLRERLVEEGLEARLQRKKRQDYTRKLDGDAEAHFVAMVCGRPPEGYKRWTLRLLAERMVELSVVDSVSHMTISRTLKKTNLRPGG
jgi:transposase